MVKIITAEAARKRYDRKYSGLHLKEICELICETIDDTIRHESLLSRSTKIPKEVLKKVFNFLFSTEDEVNEAVDTATDIITECFQKAGYIVLDIDSSIIISW